MEIDDARVRLRSIAILSVLCDGALCQIAQNCVWTRINAGKAVVSHLSKDDNVYFIVEGSFQVGLTTASGRPVAFRRLLPGDYFGEIAALTGAPRSANVVAETAALLAVWPANEFRALFRSNPSFAEAVSISLARLAVSLSNRVFELSALEVRFRLYSELLRLARDGEKTDEGWVLRDVPTHENLAATIGAQREVVTRELKLLAQEGVVLTRKRREWVIVDIERLRSLLRQRTGFSIPELPDWPE